MAPTIWTPMTESALTVEGITAGYGGGDVLHDVSFDVPAGAITCIVGPNGAGKSTLLAVISGVLRPRSGRVLHRGEPITGKSPRDVLRSGVVQVPQSHSLFPDMTVEENIELGGYMLGSRALVASRRASVEALFPDISAWSKKKAGSLSGGQQRLVEFARCLMLDPAVVILDEPSMGLAPKILRVVFGAVQEMNAQGKTVLLVEQNARAGLRMAGYGVVLETGRVRLTGTGTDVLEHPEIGRLYLGGRTDDARTSSPPARDQPAQSSAPTLPAPASPAPGPASPGPAA
jgi:ABC-type branched-subunit amino acid transport system ATPase component